jgi:very-short-patch-repair endonuclease
MQRAFWTTAELLAHGRSARWIADQVRAAHLIPVRKGHYHLPGAPEEVVRAVRVGGLATGAAGAAALGLWTPSDGRLAVAVPATASRLRDPDDPRRPLTSAAVQVHWTSERMPQATLLDRIAPVLLVLEHLFLTFPPARALTAVDSALHERRIRPADLALLGRRLPAQIAAVLALADGRAESGLETLARVLLQLAGFRVTPQVDIPGVGRVDLVVEGRLIVELDGQLWHAGRFEEDRARDAAAARLGYRTLRFTYRQVMDEWPMVFAAITRALAS